MRTTDVVIVGASLSGAAAAKRLVDAGLETVILESDTGEGPYNIRGIGEAPCIPVAPAIANAVADAVGVRMRELPITAVKVYQALREPRSSKKRSK